MPVVDLDTDSGPQEVICKLLIPFSPKWYKQDGDRYTGLVPLSEFVNTDFWVTVINTATIATGWTIGNIELEVRLFTVDLDKAIPYAPVYADATNETTPRNAVPKGPGDSRLIGLMLATTDGTAMSAQTALQLEIDQKPYLTNRASVDLLEEEDTYRASAFNALCPAAIPLLSPTKRDLGRCLVSHESAVVDGVTTSYRVISLFSETLDPNTQVLVQMGHGVDKAVAEAAVNELAAKDTDDTRGRVVSTIAKAPLAA
jgi:hypothetical protein